MLRLTCSRKRGPGSNLSSPPQRCGLLRSQGFSWFSSFRIRCENIVLFSHSHNIPSLFAPVARSQFKFVILPFASSLSQLSIVNLRKACRWTLVLPSLPCKLHLSLVSDDMTSSKLQVGGLIMRFNFSALSTPSRSPTL